MLPTFWARPIYPRVIFEDGVVLIVIEPTTASALKVDILGIVVNADCKPVAVGKYPARSIALPSGVSKTVHVRRDLHECVWCLEAP